MTYTVFFGGFWCAFFLSDQTGVKREREKKREREGIIKVRREGNGYHPRAGKREREEVFDNISRRESGVDNDNDNKRERVRKSAGD
jgi:hypothetical protein